MGAHPNGCSAVTVNGDSVLLSDLINQDKEAFFYQKQQLMPLVNYRTFLKYWQQKKPFLFKFTQINNKRLMGLKKKKKNRHCPNGFQS